MMKRSGAALMRRKRKRRRSLDGEAKWRTERENAWVCRSFWEKKKLGGGREKQILLDRLESTGRD